MFSRFNLNEKDAALLNFLLKNFSTEGAEFTIHDVSVAGYVETNTYYKHLYDKGLLIKPSKGTYSLNFELLKKLAEEEAVKKELRKQNAKKLKTLLLWAFGLLAIVYIFSLIF